MICVAANSPSSLESFSLKKEPDQLLYESYTKYGVDKTLTERIEAYSDAMKFLDEREILKSIGYDINHVENFLLFSKK